MIREAVVIALASLVGGGWIYWIAAWISTRGFLTRCIKNIDPPFHPRISILKPIKGIDINAYENFASFAKQDYDDYEILFAVLDPKDQAIPEIARLQQEFPQIAIRLVIAEQLGANPKCANLHRLAAESTADVLVLSDGDIRVTPDYLSRVVAPLADPLVGLVTCLYRGLLPQGLPGRLESLHMDAIFLPAVVLAHRLGQRVGMGATLALRRSDLLRTGGFAAIADHLMDDYQLATLIENLGRKTCLSDYIVGSVIGHPRLADQWAREVRWSRGIRVTSPAKYCGLLITYPTAWALALCIIGGLHPWTLIVLAGTLLLRWTVAWDIETLLDGDGRAILHLLPMRDLLSFATWWAGLIGNRITWRGQDFVLQRDGRLRAEKDRRFSQRGRGDDSHSAHRAVDAALPAPSPLYSGERAGVRGAASHSQDAMEGVMPCKSRPSVPVADEPLIPTLSPEYGGDGVKTPDTSATSASANADPTETAPDRCGLFSRAVRRLDRFLRRREGIFEYSTDADCMLRISFGRCDVAVTLSDGTALSPGDCVCDVHLFNDHIPAIGPGGAGIAWANQVQRGVRSSLAKLAGLFETDARFAQVKALRGQTIFVMGRGTEQLRRFIGRLHFEVQDPAKPPSLLKRLHDHGENLLLWALVRTFNPGGLRYAKLTRERHRIFMSRQTLLTKCKRNEVKSSVYTETSK